MVADHEVQQDVQDPLEWPEKPVLQEASELKDGEVFKVQMDKKVNKDHQENKAWVDQRDPLDQLDFKDHQAETDLKDQAEKSVPLVLMEPLDTPENEADQVSPELLDHEEHEVHQDPQDQPRTPSAVTTSPR